MCIRCDTSETSQQSKPTGSVRVENSVSRRSALFAMAGLAAIDAYDNHTDYPGHIQSITTELAPAVEAGRLKVVGGLYHLKTGKVELIT